MNMSLREQLLAAGLGTKKQAKQAEREQRQAPRNRQAEQEEQRKRAAEQAQAAKLARDQELNRQRELAAERKARAAEIKQLIEQHRVPKIESDDYFNFVDRGKVRRMAVDAALRARIVGGELIIVRCEGRYDLVAPDVAERIRERDARAVVTLGGDGKGGDENDPYKDFVVPDDLTW
jgi:uncharacterized protein